MPKAHINSGLTRFGGWAYPRLNARGGSMGDRCLSTAREVLRVLRYLQEASEGLTPREVAFLVGKSLYTAYYILNTLCQEGFAIKLSNGLYFYSQSSLPRALENLRALARELNSSSECRSYLAWYDSRRRVFRVEASFGGKGQVGVGISDRELQKAAHALAIGKAILAFLEDFPFPNSTTRFTAHTLSLRALTAELREIRASRVAFDREEYREGLCCIAAPVNLGESWGAIGLAMSPSRFRLEGDKLASWLQKEVAVRVGGISYA